MPDLRNFTVTKLANQTINNAPRYQIACTVHDSSTGALLKDFTGANAHTFPQILGTLTEAERVELLHVIAQWIIDNRSKT